MDTNDSKAEEFYKSFLEYTETLFAGFLDRKGLDFQSIQDMIRKLCDLVRQDRNSVVHVMQTAEPYENLHVSHSVRTSIVAVIIGMNLKLPRHQLFELGVAGLLGNLSVLSLPERIYTSSGGALNLLEAGTDAEKRALYVHPIHAQKVLKAYEFPASVCDAVLQHHELEDGSGFPQQLKGDNICMNAKILVVAGLYDAFSIEDVDKAKCGHRGIVQILKNGKIFDVQVIRALINSISIYPVGIYVLLSNGEFAQVVDNDEDNPRFPVVEIAGGKPPKQIVKTSEELSVVRPLISEEVEDFIKKSQPPEPQPK